jgi:hypothetical protein
MRDRKMSNQELAGLVWERSLNAMKRACHLMAESIPQPAIILRENGPAYRYAHKGHKEALVLKSVKYLSGMHSLQVLLDAGLVLEAGAVMRGLDEANLDIMFIAGPYIFQKALEKWHQMYLSEFFQEEFNHPDPLKSSQKRHRVSREKIRSYVARTYDHNGQSEDVSKVFGTIETALSGYVHGAANHIIDVYDGCRFTIPLQPGDGPLETLLLQRNNYCTRGLMSLSTAARGMAMFDLFDELHRLNDELFDEYGNERPTVS